MAHDDNYLQAIERWHAARIRRLTAPDGWLSLVGLAWLKPGANRIGSAADNDIVLADFPPRLGTVSWAVDGTLTLALAMPAAATIDGGHALQAVLRDDADPHPTIVAFGTTSFVAIDRSGRKGLRIRDSEAATRTGFAGIERFPVDPAWCISADWHPLEPPHPLAMTTVIGTLEAYPAPGRAAFERDGLRCALFPVRETPGDERLFLVFADATSGKETYGAARFLYADAPRDGKIVLDFNRAYNPPCVFTPHATCPLAPSENRLPLPVRAGEKTYRGGHGGAGTFHAGNAQK